MMSYHSPSPHWTHGIPAHSLGYHSHFVDQPLLGEDRSTEVEEDESTPTTRQYEYQHQLALEQQWQMQMQPEHIQYQQHYIPDHYYCDDDTAIKTEAIETAYEQFFDDFMRSGPSVPRSSPKRDASFPPAIPELHPGTSHAQQPTPGSSDHPRSPHSADSPLNLSHRPHLVTHHSLPLASSLDASERLVRSERSSPLSGREGGSTFWATSEFNLQTEREGSIEGRMDDTQVANSRIQDASQDDDGEEGAASSAECHRTQQPNFETKSFERQQQVGVPLSSSDLTSSLSAPDRHSIGSKEKVPRRPRRWLELAAITHTPPPLTPKKLRNGRVRVRTRDDSSAGDISSSSEEETHRQDYRPQYRLARPYRRRAPIGGDKCNTSRALKDASKQDKMSTAINERHDPLTAAFAPHLAHTVAIIKPWIMQETEQGRLPIHPEVHYFAKWKHESCARQDARYGRAQHLPAVEVALTTPPRQEKAETVADSLPTKTDGVGDQGKITKNVAERQVEDDEDDAAVASLLFAEEKKEVPSVPTKPSEQSPAAAISTAGYGMSSDLWHDNIVPYQEKQAGAIQVPSSLWYGTIATRISLLDLDIDLNLDLNRQGKPNSTPQDYPCLLRMQYGARLRGTSREAEQQNDEEKSDAAVDATAGVSGTAGVTQRLPRCKGDDMGDHSARRRRPATLDTTFLWANVLRRYHARIAQGFTPQQARWAGPLLPCLSLPQPAPSATDSPRSGDGSVPDANEVKGRRGAPPLFLKRNMPKGKELGGAGAKGGQDAHASEGRSSTDVV